MEFKSTREEIIELVNKLFIYTDNQQWDKLLDEVFFREVRFDMSSAGGGIPSLMKATDICDAWKSGFTGLDAIHHQAGNYLVTLGDKEQADVYCYAIASHYKRSAVEEKTREFVGSYNIGVSITKSGWRINSFKYNLKYIKGNIDLI